MPSFPVLSIVLPLLGAAGTAGLTLLPRFTRPLSRIAAQALALLVAGLTAALLLISRWRVPSTVVLSLWQPSLLFGSTLVLQCDASVYPLAFGLALITFSAALAEYGRDKDGFPRRGFATLALLSVGLFSLCSGNVLTLLVGWTLYDALLAVAHVAAGRAPREAVRGLFLGSLATLVLWAGALASGDGAIGRLWQLMPLTNARVALWALAGLLRVWAYPFHLSAPDGLGSVPGNAPLFLGPLLGWGLWIRVASANGGAVPDQGGVLAAAVITMTVGGLLAWTDEHPRRALAWAGVSASGSVLLGGRAAGQNAGNFIAAGGLSWALSMAVLLMCAGLMRAGLQRRRTWWGVPAWIGAVALVGLPLTLGFVTTAPLVGGLVRAESIAGGVAFAAAQALLVPALVRWTLLPPISPLPTGRWSTIFWLAGLALPVLTLAFIGVTLSPAIGGLAVPSLGSLMAMMTLPGWLLWIVALAAGSLLTWQESNLRARMSHLLGVVHDLWRLEWLYTATSGAIERGLSLLRAADDVVGGTGALLWSTVLFLILLLVWST